MKLIYIYSSEPALAVSYYILTTNKNYEDSPSI